MDKTNTNIEMLKIREKQENTRYHNADYVKMDEKSRVKFKEIE